jgi:hypothetical protein
LYPQQTGVVYAAVALEVVDVEERTYELVELFFEEADDDAVDDMAVVLFAALVEDDAVFCFVALPADALIPLEIVAFVGKGWPDVPGIVI